MELRVNGKLQFGKTEMLGIRERGVGFAKNNRRSGKEHRERRDQSRYRFQVAYLAPGLWHAEE